MKVIHTISDMRAARTSIDRLAFVPTMGALHAGHLSLIATANESADHVAVSIFVNPTQFGPNEDLSKYPRTLEADLQKCRESNVDLVFVPEAGEIYPPDSPDVVIDFPQLTTVLEGEHRPGHFRGVCQVVAKLFNIVKPDVACFGQKDYQQFRILSAMVDSLNWPIKMIMCPTLRENDGLAMSSRNVYLSPEDRVKALAISQALFMAEDKFKSGVSQASLLIEIMQEILSEQQLSIEYVAAVDAKTLQPVDLVANRTVLAIAARVDNTRLIDNVIVGCSPLKGQ